MTGWLGDWARTAWALLEWNVRKSLYVARGRRTECPCQALSDSGRPFETRCEAVVGWHRPERFRRRVCPLLAVDAVGRGMCSVSADRVRPFWGRVLIFWGSGGFVVATLAALAVFGTMRGIGFDVQVRQILWPPAWSELREVRAQYFLDKAGRLYGEGRVREAAMALSVASKYRPNDYAIGMIMAQFHQTGRPDLVDAQFEALLASHPDRASETSRAWFRSLLARGRLEGVARLAHDRLRVDRTDTAAWSHAFFFATKWAPLPESVDQLSLDAAVPGEVRELARLEAKMRGMSATAAAAWLRAEPLPPAGGYAWLLRAERLIEVGEHDAAIALLERGRGTLPGRDVIRLALAALATAGRERELENEVRVLLGAGGRPELARVRLVALHLIVHPNRPLLDRLLALVPQLPASPAAERDETLMAIYCASIFGDAREALPSLRAQLGGADAGRAAALLRVEEMTARPPWPLQMLLALVRPLSVELNYAILERHFRQLPRRASGPNKNGTD